MDDGLNIWTIGHSTRGAEEFMAMLRAHEIEALVDVRRYPGSRKYPHFNSGALHDDLCAAGILYQHLPELGGRRTPKPDSPNSAWRNASFRGYADYMKTPAFAAAIADLLEIARCRRTAIMCSEAVWWRCHRSLIADYLKAMGLTVTHILSEEKTQLHPYTTPAHILNGKLTYH